METCSAPPDSLQSTGGPRDRDLAMPYSSDGETVTEALLTFEMPMVSHSTTLDHRDLADRFLATSTPVFYLTLVMAGARLLRCSAIKVLTNR